MRTFQNDTSSKEIGGLPGFWCLKQLQSALRQTPWLRVLHSVVRALYVNSVTT